MSGDYAKTPLMVITVASSDLPPSDRCVPYAFAVILGDCVLPGHIIGRYLTQEEADEACVKFADHYRLRRHPYRQPFRFGPVLTLIQGGLAQPAVPVPADLDNVPELVPCAARHPDPRLPRVRCSMISEGHGPEHKRITPRGYVTHRWPVAQRTETPLPVKP